jgi:hypothetical protein
MKGERGGKHRDRKPKLHPGMNVEALTSYYWMKADLIKFARQLGLPTDGSKPELSARIEQRLRGLPDLPKAQPKHARGPRDSDKPLRRDTLIGNYTSDEKTRAFFKSQIGPGFHFTYHLNQYRLSHKNLSYGDLVDEWVAERERRRDSSYQPPIAEQGKYNRFVRDFFADEENQARSLRDAAAAWNAIKDRRGDHRYQPRDKRNFNN